MSEPCNYHHQLCEDMSIIKHDMAYIRDNVTNHITEGDKVGGYRDRVLIAESEINVIKNELYRLDKALKTEVFKTGLVGGIIGALVGQLTPEVVKILIQLLTR